MTTMTRSARFKAQPLAIAVVLSFAAVGGASAYLALGSDVTGPPDFDPSKGLLLGSVAAHKEVAELRLVSSGERGDMLCARVGGASACTLRSAREPLVLTTKVSTGDHVTVLVDPTGTASSLVVDTVHYPVTAVDDSVTWAISLAGTPPVDVVAERPDGTAIKRYDFGGASTAIDRERTKSVTTD